MGDDYMARMAAEREARIAAAQAAWLEQKGNFVLFRNGSAIEVSARPWAFSSKRQAGDVVKNMTGREVRGLGFNV